MDLVVYFVVGCLLELQKKHGYQILVGEIGLRMVEGFVEA